MWGSRVLILGPRTASGEMPVGESWLQSHPRLGLELVPKLSGQSGGVWWVKEDQSFWEDRSLSLVLNVPSKTVLLPRYKF